MIHSIHIFRKSVQYNSLSILFKENDASLNNFANNRVMKLLEYTHENFYWNPFSYECAQKWNEDDGRKHKIVLEILLFLFFIT